MPSKDIVLIKSGSLIAVDSPSDEIKRIFETTLFYHRMAMEKDEYGRVAGRTPISVECYQYITDPTGNYPVRLVAAAGYLTRIVGELRKSGYEPRLLNMRPVDRAKLQPQWDRLQDVTCKWRQRDILAAITRVRYGQIKVPPAYGKTFVIACLAELLPRATIAVVTHSLDVLSTIYDAISARIPNVGIVSGAKRRYGERVTCYSGKSLQHCTDPVDILIADECHELATCDYFSKLTSRPFIDAAHWGMSASAGDRTDKADFELEGVFGPIVYQLTYQECVANKCIVPLEVHWRPVVMEKDPAESFDSRVAKERHGIWRNRIRNEQIANDAMSFGSDEQVLITVKTIEHAVYLRKLLPEFELCYSEGGLQDGDEEGGLARAEYVFKGLLSEDEPEMTKDRRRQMREDFESGKLKRVIATSVWNRGVNFRRLAVLIRADGSGNAIDDLQIPGRTSRLCDETGKEIGVIIDYEDKFSKYFRTRALARRKNYEQHGWKQHVYSGSILESRLRAGSV